MAHALVVHAHPVPDSFNSALCARVVASLEATGHTVDLLDLYAEDFDPVMGANEWRGHRSPGVGGPALADYARRLTAAEILVFVYPTWWSEQPAILKGWFDRVWAEGVAYHRPPGAKRARGTLRQIHTLAVVTTHGSPRWINAIQGETGRRRIFRSLRVLCHPRARNHWIAMYGMDSASETERTAFMGRVEARIAKL